MKIVIHPAVEPGRLDVLRAAAPSAEWVNAPDFATASDAMAGADAFLGKITPELLARADRLRWVQTFTASLEHYIFPELVAHPCVLTNMRGLFGDVIADQVMGYVLCFARNLHTYVRSQVEHRYEPVGGESARVDNASGPGTVNAMDRATIYLPEATLGVVGLGAIGAEVARRGLAFGMTVRAVDRFPERTRPPEGSRRSRGWNGSTRCSPGATSPSSPRPTRPRPPACSTRRRSRTCGPPAISSMSAGGRSSCSTTWLPPSARADRRRGAGRLRGRAAAGRPSALGLPQRHPHPAHGRLLDRDRPAPPGDARRERAPVRPGRAPGQSGRESASGSSPRALRR